MDIKGWDTICVIRADYVNQQLSRNAAKLIQEFTISGNDPFGGAYEISGNFGPWQVVPGGSDTLIHMQIPIAQGTVTHGQGAKTDISGMAVVVEISLSLLPSPSTEGAQELRFDFKAAGTKVGDSTPGLVTPVSVTDPKSTKLGSVVETGVVNALVANGSSVSFVFATIGVVRTAVDSWLKPAVSAYSYNQPVAGATGYLAILSSTTSRDVSGLDRQIDPGLLPGDYPVTFAISKDLVLEHVVQPALPQSFPNTSASTFTFANGVITNTGSFDAPGVQKGALTYTPSIESLTISVTDNHLTLVVSGSCGLRMPNASMTFSVTAHNPLAYDASRNTISFQADPNPTTSHDNHIPWYDYILIGLSGGIGLAIFAIVAPIIANQIADSMNRGAASTDLAQTPPQTIQWQGLEAMTVKNAALNDLFYLQGVPAASA
jgi:hypothetical protein